MGEGLAETNRRSDDCLGQTPRERPKIEGEGEREIKGED